jgi:hypothetical protein
MASQANEHARRRATAAAAAAASEIRPINAKRPAKRVAKPANAGPSALAAAPLAAADEVGHACARPTPVPAPNPVPVANGTGAGPSTEQPAADTATDELPDAAHKASPPPALPPGPLPRNGDGRLPLLQSRAGIDPDERFGSQEYALSSYLKLHPVLSLESTSYQTLQLVANLVESTSIPTKELEIVDKPHDDAYLRRELRRSNPPRAASSCNHPPFPFPPPASRLPHASARTRRPPNVAIGERPCNFGDRCICVWMARWRYGEATDKAFIGTEFLLPSQAAEFKRSGKLPHTPGKCLVCNRYVTTYIYRCARADPTFKPDACIPLQAFGNALGVASGAEVPTHASVANDSDGYRTEALLFVDEQWADTAAARGAMSSLLWRPCVKFDTQHYVYVKDHSGLPRLLQRNVGAAEESSASHFCQPAGAAKRPPLPANPSTPPSPTSPNSLSS